MTLRAFRAPGRANLIGEHTDYNDGFVFPLAIDLECVVRATPRPDAMVHARSHGFHGEVELPADGNAEPPEVTVEWGRYVAAVIRVLAERGRRPVGADLVVSSTVPAGSGLSSSAALEVALALALADAAGFALEPLELARACREAEQLASGVAGGMMDQLAAIGGLRDCALLIDCRSLDVEPVPLSRELAVLIVHSGLPRTLAGTAYAERRAECERIARRLGLDALRDATPEQVRDEPRARHVVSENARVLAAAEALAAGDGEAVGALLLESHASLRDDYEVSTPELDALVASFTASGALGARLTGAGFGGCVVALARRGEADRVLAQTAERYRTATGLDPWRHLCDAADGAGPIDLDPQEAT